MSFKLSQLLNYEKIYIQCHDNPDADAIASGYALLKYLRHNGKDARFIYSGKFEIQKSNLVKMIDTLQIDIEYVKQIDSPDLLVTVDCQYGESNVTKFEAKALAVIDHHQVSSILPEMSQVMSNFGSCSTVIWKMLQEEGMDINEDEDLATALYYGLYTDTNGFAEINRPEDKDLRDFAVFRKALIVLYRNSNLSMDEVQIAGDALKKAEMIEDHKYAIVEAKPCDPNILGIISDMLLEVDTVDTCLVYSVLEFGVKLSIRSCVSDVQACELAEYIAEGLGGGGGHLVKAGGFLKRDLIEKASIEYSSDCIHSMLLNRMNNYFKDSEVLYAGQHIEDVSLLKKYVKIPVKLGYVESTALAAPGTVITIRTLEGDVNVETGEDIYIIIGIKGEIYPCKKETFEKGYDYLKEPYLFKGEYEPSVVNIETGETLKVLPYAKGCVANGGGRIYAREISSRKKVFTSWDRDHYYLGKPGDFLATRMDDLTDIYIIARDIFYLTYREE